MLGPMPKGQWVQFNTITGAGCSVSYNKGDNVQGQSHPEDCISMFKANGTQASPIMIRGNWGYGGGPSTTGSFIMLGDYGGSWQVADGNICVNPGNCGMAIAGGANNTISNNQIYSASLAWSQNGGIYVWDNGLPNPISNATVVNNKVTWYRPDGSLDGFWFAQAVTDQGNNWNAGLTASILPPVNTW